MCAHSDCNLLSAQRVKLVLLGGFELQAADRVVTLPLSAERLLAFLALQPAPLLRGFVAEGLWPDTNLARANANLRSAVWRVRQVSPDLIQVTGHRIRLARHIEVDLRRAEAVAHGLLDPSTRWSVGELAPDLAATLSVDLLPGWFDEWLLLWRDRWAQLRLHALEALAERLLASGALSQAVEVALSAVWAEPLRESAHRILIRVHAAEGNWSQAVLQYRYYKQLLYQELRTIPTAQMEELIRDLTPRQCS